jgi:hypothetical protein
MDDRQTLSPGADGHRQGFCRSKELSPASPAYVVLTAMSSEPFDPLDSKTLSEQLQEASERMRFALRQGYIARHHLLKVQVRLDALAQQVAALRHAMSRKSGK